MHWDSIENKRKTFIESQCGQSSGQTQPIDCFDFVMTTRCRCHRTELHKRQFFNRSLVNFTNILQAAFFADFLTPKVFKRRLKVQKSFPKCAHKMLVILTPSLSSFIEPICVVNYFLCVTGSKT